MSMSYSDGDSLCSDDDAQDYDETELSETMEKVMNGEKLLARIREDRIASLGEGFDDKTLLELDRRLAKCYDLDDDEDGYDDDDDEGGEEEGKTAPKPTTSELEHYQKSMVKRQRFLMDAISHQAMIDSLNGHDYKNLALYQDLYNDIRTYRFAWFGIIFQQDHNILTVCPRLKNLAMLQMQNNWQEAVQVVELFNEIKDVYQVKVTDDDIEACQEAGNLEYDGYELNYFMAERLAQEGPDEKEQASTLFHRALMSEDMYLYKERYCWNLLKFATGQPLSASDLTAIALGDDDDGVVDLGQQSSFYYDCLRATLYGKYGSVPWKRPRLCEACALPESAMSNGKKLLVCSRCKNVTYCSKDCQKKDWKYHKIDCLPTTAAKKK